MAHAEYHPKKPCTSHQSHSKIMVVALQLNTDTTGYALSFKNNPCDIRFNAAIYRDWQLCVLTKPDGSFDSFGHEAKSKYDSLDPEKDNIGGPHGYNLFSNFSMLLEKEQISLKSTLVSTDGHIRKALDIYVMVLCYLKRSFLKRMSDCCASHNDFGAVWVLVYPSNWKDGFQEFMLEVAKMVGFPVEDVILVSDSAATCAYFTHQFVKRNEEKKVALRSKDKILVIDAGSDQVHFTAHQLRDEWNVTDLVQVSQGPWGANYVEKKFAALFARVFGSDVINRYIAEYPAQWSDVMECFRKHMVYSDGTAKSPLRIPIPWSFDTFIGKLKNMKLKEICEGSVLQVTFNIFTITCDTYMSLFSFPISHIIQHAHQLLENPALEGCRFITLVGKFGKSVVLQKACLDAFQGSMEVLIPYDPNLVPLRGAVYLGHKPEFRA